MSTVDRPEPLTLPPLVAGQRLDQPTFHERYKAMPPGTRAELIDGVVSMPSPLLDPTGETEDIVAFWLMSYRKATPGVRAAANATVKFAPSGEVQPDNRLRIPPEAGGLSHVDEAGYLVGPPELIVEVGNTTRANDLGPKKDQYERSGVPEYLFVGLEPQEVRWFSLRRRRYVKFAPGPDGILRSEIFPGLWLDPQALLGDDLDRLIDVLAKGLRTPEHAAFVARLAAGRAD